MSFHVSDEGCGKGLIGGPPEIFTMRKNSDDIRGLLYSYYTIIAG